jgi:HEAT repeat protein
MQVNKFILLGIIVVVSAGSEVSRIQTSTNTATVQTEAERIVDQMRGFSMQMPTIAPSDGRISPIEQRRQAIMKELRRLGDESVPPLARALSDTDVQMRRNAVLVLIYLGGGYSPELQPKLDIRKGMRELIRATEDRDRDVRAWAAHALAEMGSDAKEAIPALLRLLEDREEGPRNTSCLALGRIGPAAEDALPALRAALNDPSRDVRGCAQQAIAKIQKD